MHEILTLQLGHSANYLATHFWNTQESYFTYDSTQAPSLINHDVHFRAGSGAKGEETYTPRTLIYDLKGGFGGLRKWGGLYEQQQSDTGQGDEAMKDVWDGNVLLQTDPQIAQSDYQRSLDEGAPSPTKLSTQTVRYWADFNRVFYHPRSIAQINDYELGSSLTPFEKWANGEELFAQLDRNVDLLDRDMRLWAEECDQMQGIQIYTGSDDAWGGFASRYVEELRDEFGKLPIWTWGIEGEHGKGQKPQQLLRTLNVARTIKEISMHGSMYIPLATPTGQLPACLHLDHNSHWHRSALSSLAVETTTLPSRLRSNGGKRGLLGDLEAALNVNGNQRIAQLRCRVLDPDIEIPDTVSDEGKDNRIPSAVRRKTLKEDDVPDVLPGLDMNFMGMDIQSTLQSSDHIFGAIEQKRGAHGAPTTEIDNDEDLHTKKRRRFAGLSVIERYRCSLEYPLLDSFPAIFSFRPKPDKVAVHTSLSTTSRVANHIKTLRKSTMKLASQEEREYLSNGLGEISEAYEEGWESGSGDSDDD